MSEEAADWLMGPSGVRTKREAREIGVTKKDVAAAVAFLEDAAVRSGEISEAVQRVVTAALSILGSGLTRRAVCVLVQDRLGKGPGGRPEMSIEQIDKVLSGLVDLSAHLSGEGSAPRKSKR